MEGKEGRSRWSGGQGLVGKNRKSRTCTNKEWMKVLHDIDTNNIGLSGLIKVNGREIV